MYCILIIVEKEVNEKNSNKEELNMKKTGTKKLVLGALMAALVVILQYMGSFVRFGPFSISLVLIPIVIGAITCGKEIGAFLGLIFGMMVFITGDAALFLAVNASGTIITVILKGVLCGYLTGLTYEVILKISKRKYFSAVVSAIICPIVNTGIFLAGCYFFFLETVTEWGVAAGFGNVGAYMIFGLVGANFLVELGFNVVFAPAIVHILKAVKRS